jgi:hypothetical protein
MKLHVKVKAVPLLPCRHQGGEGYSSNPFLTSALDGSEWHTPAVLYPQESTPSTHWIGGWVGLRAGLDTEVRGESFASAKDQTLAVQSVDVCKILTPLLIIIHSRKLNGLPRTRVDNYFFSEAR